MINLKGLRVLNTRPLEQNSGLSQAINESGGFSIELPALTIQPTADAWLKNLPHLATINHVIFISANAVNYFFKPLRLVNNCLDTPTSRGLSAGSRNPSKFLDPADKPRDVAVDIVWPTSIETTAVGKGTAAALSSWGIRIDHVPIIADSDHLLQLDALQQVQERTIVLVKGEHGRMDIANTLLARGANLIGLDVYRRTLPKYDQALLHSLWQENSVDIILFTSQQAIHNIFTLFGEKARSWLCNKPCLVISERIAETAFKFGMQTVIISQYDTILNTLERYYQGLTHDYKQ